MGDAPHPIRSHRLRSKHFRDKCEELADDVRALLALGHALRRAVVAVGVWLGVGCSSQNRHLGRSVNLFEEVNGFW